MSGVADTAANSEPPDFSVIGAGMVGVSCALQLLDEGFTVALFEARAPGAGASAGNAGNIGTASIVPTGVPGLARKVPGMLLDPLAPLAIDWRHAPRLVPWLIALLRQSRPERVEAITTARHALLERTPDAYDALLRAAGLGRFVKPVGKLLAYETDATFAGARSAMESRRRRGIRVDLLSGDEARELEPALGAHIRHAVHFPDVHYISDPLGLVQGLVRNFTARGGTLVEDEVVDFELGGAGPSALIGRRGRHPCRNLVVAAGAWSRDLARRLGTRLPIEAERGYNVTLRNPSLHFRYPVTFQERFVAMTPMDDGMRLCGMAEFAGLHARPKYERLDAVLAGARLAMPGLTGEEGPRWAGDRPSLPDSLPAIGRSKRHANVFFACGHDHIGLTLGPITGRLIAQLATGRTSNLDLSPYDPNRFS